MRKAAIIKYLKEKDIYEVQHDSLIDEIVYNFSLIRKSKTEIKRRGLMVPGSKDGLFMVKNPAISVYNDALKNIGLLISKMGLTPSDLVKLKVQNKLTDDFKF